MDMKVLDIVDSCNTNADGAVVYSSIQNVLDSYDAIIVDFTGVPNATSSFINVSFVSLVETMGFDDFARRVRVIGANRQISALLRDRVSRLRTPCAA